MSSKTEFLPVATPLVFQSGAASPAVTEGSILVEAGSHLPDSLRRRGDSCVPGWSVVANTGSILEKDMKNAGWSLFFMAGEVAATGFGLKSSLRRFARKVKSQHCNCFEITHIARERFLGLARVRVSGHARQLQNGLTFAGNLVTRN